MRASYRWITELSGSELTVEHMADALTSLGLEVEAVVETGNLHQDIVLAEVKTVKPHPSRPGLSCIEVWDGSGTFQVISGAPNVASHSEYVAFGRVGAKQIDGKVIEKRSIAQTESHGVLFSEAELGIGGDAKGILRIRKDEVQSGAAVGAPLREALALRDSILEINITPNRPDCLGCRGIAREVLTFTKRSAPVTHHDSYVDFTSLKTYPSTFVTIEDGAGCFRYDAFVVKNVNVEPSCFSTRYRLHNLGVRALSNIVDVTNLILLEYGQPVHAFDLDLIEGERIIIRRAKKNEKILTLDGVERSLHEGDLVICDQENPVALAGVMGGAKSEVSDSTRNVLLETATFDPRTVRRTSKRHGLHTEASHRFERGVDPDGVSVVSRALASRVQNVSGGIVEGKASAVAKPYVPTKVAFRTSRVKKMLGMDVSMAECESILQRLGFTVDKHENDAWRVMVPSWRVEISREADLIEEIARVYGYDRVPTEVPRIQPSPYGTAPLLSFIDDIKISAVHQGLYETINYVFVSEEQSTLVQSNGDASRTNQGLSSILLANPLSKDRDRLRTSLLPGLLSAALRTLRHEQQSVRIFEIGHIYGREASELIEKTFFGALITGPRWGWLGAGNARSDAHDFYDLKGIISSVFFGAGIPLSSIETVRNDAYVSERPFLHPRRSAQLQISKEAVGWIGELHPEMRDALGFSFSPIVVEVDIDRISELTQAEASAISMSLSELPKFPSVSRDVALTVQESVASGDILNEVRERGQGLVENVWVFDIYRGAPVPQECKSIALRIVYRSAEGTLTDALVDSLHKSIIEALRANFEAQLRS